MSLTIGLTYDLRSDYLAAGFSEEQVAEFDSLETIDHLAAAITRLPDVDRFGLAMRRRSARRSWQGNGGILSSTSRKDCMGDPGKHRCLQSLRRLMCPALSQIRSSWR
jgi:hypothetical protein